jgi:hypothetical protein
MKKILMAVALVATMFAAENANAVTFNDGTFVYSIIEGTDVMVGNNSTSYANGLVAGTSYSGSVTVPATVTNSGTTYSATFIGRNAFFNCSRLTSVTIPNSVTTIGDRAFDGCSGLTSVTIPNSVTTIGESAFSGCRGLTSVTIGNSVTTIGSYAFAYCSSLISVIIPNSVTTIGSYAFDDCNGLMSVTVGNSVSSIGELAFRYCRGLTSVTSLAVNPPVLGTDAFYGVSKTIPVHVPCASEDAYQSATGWGDFTNYTGCVSNGLNDIDVADISVYPNPASDRIFIEGEDFDAVKLYDILGKEVLSSNKTKEVDISNLPNGIYNVRIMANNKAIAIRKIVKK